MTIALSEACRQFDALVDRAERGEEITITREGLPVARLVPAEVRNPAAVRAAIEKIRELRKGQRLEGLSIRELIDEGRR